MELVQLGEKTYYIKNATNIGSKNNKYKLDDKKTFILQELENGISKRKLAKKLNVTVATLNRFLERLQSSI